MRGLYITNMDIKIGTSAGVAKKIAAQLHGFRQNGVDMDIAWREVNKTYHIERDGADIASFFSENAGRAARRKKAFDLILSTAKKEKYDFLYIRKFNLEKDVIDFLKAIKKRNICVIMEIPTYPYYREYYDALKAEKNPLTMAMIAVTILNDKIWVNSIKKCVDYTATYSEDDSIFGVKCIKVVNGTDFSLLPYRTVFGSTDGKLRLIAVANARTWHGYDRLIKGLYNYYQNNPNRKVLLSFLGDGSSTPEYKELVKHYALEEFVSFHGIMNGDALQELLEKSDFAINSLGMHRTGLNYSSTLKSREYAAAGLPMLTSAQIDVFPTENTDFVLKCPEDESDIDVGAIFGFYDGLLDKYGSVQALSEHIRKSAEEKTDVTNVVKPIIECIRSKNETQ